MPYIVLDGHDALLRDVSMREIQKVVPTSPFALSKTISHALRHEPELYSLRLDPGGWVDLDALFAALAHKSRKWSNLTVGDLEQMIGSSRKRRFEIQGTRIRATYGHSHSGRIERTSAEPPAIPYHGTDPDAVQRILAEGLKPMARQNVHLSADVETAVLVRCRKGPSPVILQVDAAQAHASGVTFYYGKDSTWLADHAPATFVSILTGQ